MRDGEGYAPAASSYTVDELKTKSFYLHGHTVSSSPRDKEIEVVHSASGAKDRVKLTVDEYKFTVYVDQPGEGLNVPFLVYTNEQGQTVHDVGHAFWKFESKNAQLCGAYSDLINMPIGFYPKYEQHWFLVGNDTEGELLIPDTKHTPEVQREWYVTKASMIRGLAHVGLYRNECLAGTRKYNAISNNCVNAVVDVAASLGIQLPCNPSVYVGPLGSVPIGLTSGQFGEDIKNLDSQ